jgi:hypothetical protein
MGRNKTRRPDPDREIPPPISQESRLQRDGRIRFFFYGTQPPLKTAERTEGGTLRAGAEKRRQAPPTGGVDGGGRTGRNRVLFSGCSDVDLIGEETP